MHTSMDSTSAMNVTLPLLSSLSPSAITFLDAQFNARDDLLRAPDLSSELCSQCHCLHQCLSDLCHNLEASLTAYASQSDRIGGLFADVCTNLAELQSSTGLSTSQSDGGGGLVVEEELATLAKEVARVEAVRKYADTVLNLDTMVGNIEDAVSATVNKNLRRYSSAENPDEMYWVAIKTLRLTEDILTSVTKMHPHWRRLVLAVDYRIDRALSMLRPQAVANHRALLASLGWPPPLSTLHSSTSDVKRSTDISNPLFAMQDDLKNKYRDSFLALCSLQELQRQRKCRQLEGHHREVALRQPLWAIEELVNPLVLASQKHFSKWVNKPEFIFALVYKITRDYVDSMDELLQPLVDEAKLLGYSCREEWVAAMSYSLSTYLAKEIFPIYISQLDKENPSDMHSQARIAWLNLVDMMITFDKRVQSLVEHSGIPLTLEEDGNLLKFSSFLVFCDRPDWLDLWTEIECNDTLDKLKPIMEDERSWTTGVQGTAVLPSSEDYRSPAVSTAFLRCLHMVVGRCRSLPSNLLRSRFLRLVGAPIIHKFLDCLLLRCQEAEGLTALTDDQSLIKVAKSINAAHYVESVLKEWSEDVFFLEMGLSQSDHLETVVCVDSTAVEATNNTLANGIFDGEITKLVEFRMEWVEKLSTVVLRGFDARSRDYIKNKKQWHVKGEEGWMVSKTFVGALDYLQGKTSVIEQELNGMDFIGVWRSLASGVDRLLFNGILMGNVKFYDVGVERLGTDFTVLFGIFRAWCLRPEGFFPKVGESLKLLKMGEKQLRNSILGGEGWLKENEIRHLKVAEVERIVKNRVYSS